MLGLDAAIIAAAWLAVFSSQSTPSTSDAAYLVLGLSVWLTYLADRLFDVSSRPMVDLLSTRHQFAKVNRRKLWLAWWVILILSVALALTGLTGTQLLRGFGLLLLCLCYTLCNQLLSKRFFPKEIFVAAIFTAGTQIFLDPIEPSLAAYSFALLCLGNCLMIAHQEKAVDAKLRQRSTMQLISPRSLYFLLLASGALGLMSQLALALLPPAICLLLLLIFRRKISGEPYRVCCDTALLVGPAVYFFGSGVLVR